MNMRFRRRQPLPWVVAVLLILLVAYRGWQVVHQDGAPDHLPEGEYQVARVVDGDTLLLTNRARVRLIGADTPETVRPDRPPEPWGAEATQFTEEFLADGLVMLRLDRERKDRFDRFLAYAYVGERMLNEELIRAGLARARLEFHYAESMKRRFRQAQEEAQSQGRGIWSKSRNMPRAASPRSGRAGQSLPSWYR